MSHLVHSFSILPFHALSLPVYNCKFVLLGFLILHFSASVFVSVLQVMVRARISQHRDARFMFNEVMSDIPKCPTETVMAEQRSCPTC